MNSSNDCQRYVFSDNLNNIARVRYGEDKIENATVFKFLLHNPKLVCDCAILCACIYDRDAATPSMRPLPTFNHKWKVFREYEAPLIYRNVKVTGGLGQKIRTTRLDMDVPTVAFIFRGTRFTKWPDWHAVLRWFTYFSTIGESYAISLSLCNRPAKSPNHNPMNSIKVYDGLRELGHVDTNLHVENLTSV